ncbi:MAG: hypothetical protein KGL46_13390 [Hyphomicrobiales bacterium]|nr:hypothetical protein [Hyphomicrobiales bacterium]
MSALFPHQTTARAPWLTFRQLALGGGAAFALMMLALNGHGARAACLPGAGDCISSGDIPSGFGGAPKFSDITQPPPQAHAPPPVVAPVPGLVRVPASPPVRVRELKATAHCRARPRAPAAPFALSVDGMPANGGPPHDAESAALCVDSALERAEIQVRYDGLDNDPRLNVIASPNAANRGAGVAFKSYSNYSLRLARSEIRIFPAGASTMQAPAVIVPMTGDDAYWVPPANAGDGVIYVLRVYDREGRFDETAPQRLDLAAIRGGKQIVLDPVALKDGNRREVRNIPVDGGSVIVSGKNIHPGETVTVMGVPVTADSKGDFAMREIFSPGRHDVEVVIDDRTGRAVLTRSAIVPERDVFYVALADATVSTGHSSGPWALINPDQPDNYKDRFHADGRLAFYLKAKQGETMLTASADTRDQPIRSLFSNFTSTDPTYLLRTLDPNRYYPVYGDDSTLVEDAPTRGKFYVRLDHRDSNVMWGNFKTSITGTEFARYDRGLYGARAQTKTSESTAYGERRGTAEAFAAQPGTLGVRDVFIGTGGSMYFLSRQNITQGSERITVETRDVATGLVLASRTLAPTVDYDVNYLQGRILLNTSLSMQGSSAFLVQSGGLGGVQNYLVVNYEYSPIVKPAHDYVAGGRATYWLNDHVQVGVTAYDQMAQAEKLFIGGADVTMRYTPTTYLKLEGARSSGAGSGENLSYDGGFTFQQHSVASRTAMAKRAEAAVNLADIFAGGQGRITAFYKQKDAGFAGPGELALNDYGSRQMGVAGATKLGENWSLRTKIDSSQDYYHALTAGETDVSYAFSRYWSATAGVRMDGYSAYQPTYSPDLNQPGRRIDTALRFDYKSDHDWGAYVYGQKTVMRTGLRQENNRIGIGAYMRLSEKITASAEGSIGNLGPGAKIGLEMKTDQDRTAYINYAANPDRTDIMERGGLSQVTAGARQRYTDTLSAFGEEKMRGGGGYSGLTHAYGLDFTPTAAIRAGLKFETGKLTDPLSGTIQRTAVSPTIGYTDDRISYTGRFEYRHDDQTLAMLGIPTLLGSQQNERTTYLMNNLLTMKLSPDWRLIAKLNGSYSTSSLGDFNMGNYFEGVLGAAYRPTTNDRINMLFKYTFFYNVPSPGQVVIANSINNYSQRSHVLSADAIYDVNQWLSIGGKYGLRISETRDNLVGGSWFSNDVHLFVARADWHVVKQWDVTAELREMMSLSGQNRQPSALLAVYRHLNDNFKVGVGYNFSRYSDDLTNLSMNNRGLFVNAIGKF